MTPTTNEVRSGEGGADAPVTATRVSIIYYSATGNVHRLAHASADGAQAEGAEVRVRHVEEIASELG